MADALTHFATAYLPAKGLKDGRVRAILYVGVILPDILYKTLLYCFGASTWLCEPTHSPLGVAAMCYALALLFEETWRKRAFWALAAGAWTHILVDAAKNYMGMGVIPWAFPFSMDLFEFGWMRQEETIYLAGVALALLLIAGCLRLLCGKKGRPPEATDCR